MDILTFIQEPSQNQNHPRNENFSNYFFVAKAKISIYSFEITISWARIKYF